MEFAVDSSRSFVMLPTLAWCRHIVKRATEQAVTSALGAPSGVDGKDMKRMARGTESVLLYMNRPQDHGVFEDSRQTPYKRQGGAQAAMVTSTSTPGSIDMEVCTRCQKTNLSKRREVLQRGRRTICLTISAGLWRSMSRLWIFISYRSQVFEPSPQGYGGKEMINMVASEDDPQDAMRDAQSCGW